MKIKVMLVDDSRFALTGLAHLIQEEPDMEVVAQAKSGKEALELLPQVKPDIVCLDYYMTEMSGYEVTKRIMADSPLPILIVSGILSHKDTEKIFELLEAGALDVISKPIVYQSKEKQAEEFITKIRLLSKVFVFKKMKGDTAPKTLTPFIPYTGEAYQLIAMGASTGGPLAIKKVIESLPEDFQVPLVVVQHMSKGFLEGFMRWLEMHAPLSVKVAENNEMPLPGYLYFPPEDMHLYITPQGALGCTQTLKTNQHHRPSIDVLMESVAKTYGKSAIGVLLTGMGSDGAQGMLALSRAGGVTIVQESKSCIVASMPEEATKLSAAQYILPLSDIGPFILKLVENG